MIELHVDKLVGGNITITTGGSTPATRAVTRIWWSNDESDYSDCPSNSGTFDSSCFPEEKYNSDAVKVEFGSDVTSIGGYVFCDCSSLTIVTIPNSVTSIGQYAFSGCTGLTSVTIGNSVTNIEAEAFSYCSDMTSMTIPDSVTDINSDVFCGCVGLTSVTFEGKDKATVQGMMTQEGFTSYPFGLYDAIPNGVIIHCTDGDIQVQYEGE